MSEDHKSCWLDPFSAAPTLLQHASTVATTKCDEPFLSWIDGRGQEDEVLTFGELWGRTEKYGALILNASAVGDNVLLCFEPGLRFYITFWACLRIRVVAVPVYPPDPTKLRRAIEKLELIRNDCAARLCVTDNAVTLLRTTKGLLHTWPPELEWLNIQSLGLPPSLDQPALDQASTTDLAFLQARFTSGSTGDPKGVMLTHGNVWHNVSLQRRFVNEIIIPFDVDGLNQLGFRNEDRPTIVSWLPQYHDLGTFLSTPTIWLDVASTFEATGLVSPDFGYRLLTKRVRTRVTPPSWDLSSMFFCMTAAERVRESTYVELREVLEPFSFRATICPAYGLAEHVVGVCVRYGIMTSSSDGSVGCGSPETCACSHLKIVDPDTRRQVGDGETGEIFLSSPSVAQGYWKKPEISEATFRARIDPDDGRTYLRTGDLGFIDVHDKCLRIQARLKDLIIIGGTNCYADDIEIAAGSSSEAIRQGCIAAFATETGHEEALVVVLEIRASHNHDAAAIANAASTAIALEVGIRPRRIVVIRERTIPKTTSGKIRRRATREALHAGELQVVFDSSSRVPSSQTTRVSFLTSINADVIGETTTTTIMESTPAVSPPQATLGAGWQEEIATRVGALRAAAAASSAGDVSPRGLGKAAVEMVFETRDSEMEARLMSGCDDDLVSAVQLCYVEIALLTAARDAFEGQNVELTTCLADCGLTSQEAARLCGSLEMSLQVQVPVDLMMRPETPMLQVAREILDIAAGATAADIAPRRSTMWGSVASSYRDSWGKSFASGSSLLMKRFRGWDILQGLCIFLIPTLVALALVPAYHFGLFAQWKRKTIVGHRIYVRRDLEPWSHIKVRGTKNVYAFGLLLPWVIPIFILSLSVIAVSAKWLIVGRYRPRTLKRGTAAFMRWWLCDRLFDQWEQWAGLFLKDTILITVFYRLCGANVALDASINTFLREFELVTVGSRSSVSGSIYARWFVSAGRLRFASVGIGRQVQIASFSVVMPGTTAEDGATLDHNSATMVGTRLAGNTCYAGSPAKVVHDKLEKTEGTEDPLSGTANFYFEESLKLAMLCLILYIPFVLTSVLISVIFRRVDWHEWETFRHSELLYWVLHAESEKQAVVLSYMAGILTFLACTIASKWILVGRVKPGCRAESMRLRIWFVEYMWYRVIVPFGLIFFCENGLVTTYVYKAMGASISNDAILTTLYLVSPVEADCLSVESDAFLSGGRCSCVGKSGEFKRVSIGAASNIGFGARVNAGALIESGATVGHQSTVPEDGVVKSGTVLFNGTVFGDATSTTKRRFDVANIRFKAFIGTAGLRTVLLAALGFSLIPAYELAVLCFYGDADFYKDDEYLRGISDNLSRRWSPPIDRTLAVVLLGPIALVALASWSVTLRIYQRYCLFDFVEAEKRSESLWFLFRYMHYQILQYALLSYAMPFVYGSSFAVYYLRFWGADVASNVYCNGAYIYEAPLLRLEADCVIDKDGLNIAHVFMNDKLYFRTKIIGRGAILHPGVITWAGDVVPPGVVMGPLAQLQSQLDSDTEAGTTRYAPGTYVQG
ncbi:hypothetical protein CTAYLR_000943, partial [Chrysophaeum taylorii]